MFFDFLTKKEKKIESQEIEKYEDQQDFDVIVSGCNSFDTNFLTLIKYLSKYREYFINEKGSPNIPELVNYLSWDKNIEIDFSNFSFVYDFIEAYQHIASFFPLNLIFDDKLEIQNFIDTHSTKVKFFNIGKGISKDEFVSFDFYKIPEKINPAVIETIDSDFSGLLEQYIEDGTIDSDVKYVEVCQEMKNFNYNVTIPNYNILRAKYDEDKFFLESVHSLIYHRIKVYYDIILNNIIYWYLYFKMDVSNTIYWGDWLLGKKKYE